MKPKRTLIQRPAMAHLNLRAGATLTQPPLTKPAQQARVRLACFGWPLLLLLVGGPLYASSIIQFSAAAYNVTEGTSQVEIAVQRTGGLDAVVSVAFATTNLTATSGADYLDVSTNLTFLAGETNQIVGVPILNDGLVEGYETFQVQLSNPTGGAELGTRASATVRISSNDTGLQLEFASHHREDEEFVQIEVLRGDDSNFPVTVEYATADGTAKAGQDYTPVNGQLDFAAGEQVKLVLVPLLNDGLKEANETFRLYLTNATGTVLGSRKLATITLVDNDLGVHFEPNTLWVSESEGTVTLKVVRGNDIELGAFTVDYATRNLTATAGEDYTESKGTLQFARGELEKLLTIPITHDETAEPDEKFTVTLNDPTGATVLHSTYSLATVTIVESVEPWVADRRVAQMVAHVQPADLVLVLEQVTGKECVLVGGDAYVLSNRNTSSDPTAPVWRATQLAFEYLRALGLDVQYQGWKAAGFTNVNVVGTQPGEGRPDEFVLVTAHLDDEPVTLLAPGADDNASGVAAVLAAARIFSQYQFDRTVQFVLFTGEEQGLLGSAAYAARARAERRKLVAVINPDMVGWEPALPPRCNLTTRSTSSSHPDFAIAFAFLKVVETYGLQGSLWPVLAGNTGYGSDQMSFWGSGFPALSLFESSWASNPNYHTATDGLRQLNLRYLSAVVGATVGTLAHLAQPKGERPLGILEVATSDWTPGSRIGGALFHAKHAAGASEEPGDVLDLAWSNAPTNAHPKRLRIATEPDGVALQTDARPSDSETIFRTQLSVVDATGTGVSCPNRLRFSLLTPPDTNRIYLARIHVDGRYVAEATDFDCVTNLQEVIAAGGCVTLPSLSQVPDRAVYGTCDLAARLLETSSANCILRLASVSDRSILLMASAQLGTHIVDDLEVSTELGSSTAWAHLKSYTNYVSPDAAHFEAGWREIARDLDPGQLPASGACFFRIRRTWIGP